MELSSLVLSSVDEKRAEYSRLLRPMLQAVSRSSCLQSLVDLKLEWHEDWSGISVKPEYYKLSLQPLYSLSRLKSVLVDIGQLIDLEDADLLEMSKAWPDLEVFKTFDEFMHGELDTAPIVNASFVGVTHLLKGCRDLRKLWLPFNLMNLRDAFDESDRELFHSLPRSSLEELHVGSGCRSRFPSECNDLVVGFVRTVAPKLKTLRSGMLMEHWVGVPNHSMRHLSAAPWSEVARRVPVEHKYHWDERGLEDNHPLCYRSL
jgi:hypothetical protein